MPGVDLASMLETAVTEKIERLEAKRFAKVPLTAFASRSRWSNSVIAAQTARLAAIATLATRQCR